jgi:hypothetical protein
MGLRGSATAYAYSHVDRRKDFLCYALCFLRLQAYQDRFDYPKIRFNVRASMQAAVQEITAGICRVCVEDLKNAAPQT